ncbi:MAG: hypothetical protein HC913_06400 [Microscillaceae bacterium]|nr:hypothetical protein [Microscillaceae bacterium]
MNVLRSYWQLVSDFGLSSAAHSYTTRRNIVFCNRLNLLLVLVSGLRFGFEIISGQMGFYIWSSGLSVVMAVGVLYLNYRGKTTWGRRMTAYIYLLMAHFPLWLGRADQVADYVSFGYIYLILTVISLLVLDFRKERAFLLLNLGLLGGLYLSYDIFFHHYYAQAEQMALINQVFISQKIVQILIWLFIIASIWQFRSLVQHYECQLEEKNQTLYLRNEEINRQNEEISAQNEEIISQNEELRAYTEKLNQQQEDIEAHNQQVKQAFALVAEKNEALEVLTKALDHKVNQRTEEITQINQELIEKNGRLEQFAFTVAHNVRAPVARIIGLVQVLEIENLVNEKNRPFIEALQKVAENLDKVIRDLNQLIDIGKGIYEARTLVNIPSLVERIQTVLKPQLEDVQALIRLRVEEVPEIISIENYVESILYNLISNALKYRSPSRRLRIDIQTSLRPSGEVLLLIQDNGLGIDLALYGQDVFRPYRRFHAHIEGKGLGLYLVKTQVEALGGKIFVESQIEEGASFSVLLPHHSPAASNIPKKQNPNA